MEQILGRMSKVRVTWERKCKNRFLCIIFIKSRSIYIKPRQKWSPAHSTHIVEYISPAKMLRFVIIWKM